MKPHSAIRTVFLLRLCDELVTGHVKNTPSVDRLAPVYPEHKNEHPGLAYYQVKQIRPEPEETI